VGFENCIIVMMTVYAEDQRGSVNGSIRKLNIRLVWKFFEAGVHPQSAVGWCVPMAGCGRARGFLK